MGSFYEGIVKEFFFFMVEVILHCFAICPHHTVHLNMEPHISNEGVCCVLTDMFSRFLIVLSVGLCVDHFLFTRESSDNFGM